MKETFKEGQTIFFANALEKKIESRIVERVEMRESSPVYWLLGHFGYFDPYCLFKTHIEAKDYIRNLEAQINKI
jgi:hypothetical protein